MKEIKSSKLDFIGYPVELKKNDNKIVSEKFIQILNSVLNT